MRGVSSRNPLLCGCHQRSDAQAGDDDYNIDTKADADDDADGDDDDKHNYEDSFDVSCRRLLSLSLSLRDSRRCL